MSCQCGSSYHTVTHPRNCINYANASNRHHRHIVIVIIIFIIIIYHPLMCLADFVRTPQAGSNLAAALEHLSQKLHAKLSSKEAKQKLLEN